MTGVTSTADLGPGALAYLATPYTLYRHGHDFAFREACRLTGELIAAGIEIFSPIVHCHAITSYSVGLDPLDNQFWLARLAPFMSRCDVLIVAEMDGWKDSAGIAHEISAFARAFKPVFSLDPVRLTLRRSLTPGRKLYG